MANENDDIVTEAPVVPEGTKFRRGGFKSVEQIEEAGRAAGEIEPEDPVLAAAEAEATSDTPLPEGFLTEETPAPEEPTEPEPSKAKIRLAGKTFETQEEAWAYAEELEQERVANDAFRQGVEAAQNLPKGNIPTEAAPPKPRIEITPDYYAEPEKFLEKFADQIIQETQNKIESKSALQRSHDQTWKEFYSDFPDLIGSEWAVNQVLAEKWNTVSKLEKKTGLSQVANETRNRINKILEARMPKTELKRVTATASSGGPKGVTPPKAPEKIETFVQQSRRLKAAKLGAGKKR